MLDLLKFLGAPGSISCLVLSVAAGLAVLRYVHRLRRLALLWLTAISLSYVALALPLFANAIAGSLPAVDTPTGRVDTLIVLDGDNRRGRVREVQRALRDQSPAAVWVLGGRWILEALEEAGVSGPTFRYDATAANTLEQMEQIARLANVPPKGRTAVIASRLQAPRVASIASARGLRIAVVPSPIDDEPPTVGLRLYVPSYTALRVSRDAIYEHAALAYYRWRGWIG